MTVSYITLTFPRITFEVIVDALQEYIDNPRNMHYLRYKTVYVGRGGHGSRLVRLHSQYLSFNNLRSVRSALKMLKRATRKGQTYSLAVPHDRERALLSLLDLSTMAGRMRYGSYRRKTSCVRCVAERIRDLRKHINTPLHPLKQLAAQI